MTKHAQFLFMVQTAILANAVNISAMKPEEIRQHRHNVSASGVLGVSAEAIRAADMIPESMSADEAARQFCGYMLTNLREATEAAHEVGLDVPAWFARS